MMFEQAIIGIASLGLALTATPSAIAESWPEIFVAQKETSLAKVELDMTKRISDPFGNQVFSDNILLALHYLKGDISNSKVFPELNGQKFRESDWDKIRKPFTVEFILNPGEVFAFHDNVLPEFNPPVGGPQVTMKSKFMTGEGYESYNGLGGNGVCHLASLLNWAARQAGLAVIAKRSHDFFPIPGVDRQYGTSIMSTDAGQNLYIKNNFDKPVKFLFKANGQKLELEIVR